jgi:membrane-associated phospholipid phosphatase
MMIKRRSHLLLLLLIFHFCCYKLSGQNSPATKNFTLDTIGQQAHYHESSLKPAALILPGSLLLYGCLKPVINGIPKLDNKIMKDIQQRHPGFHTNAADYLMWAPSASVYAMDALHVKTAHNFREHLIIEAGSVIITGGIGYGMRLISRNKDAYKTSNTKFPSGHTANAFRAAEIVHQELKKYHPVLSYSGYVVATGVGILRIYGKEHFLSEVLAGAGLGMLSTKLTYWIFNKVK